ncbi:MAG: AAA family ATPase [Bacilli bacterium]|nr:AAA family ATPase [Bacilli bacterium]
MANLIVITGAQASGKMTIGKALSEKIGYRLITNHDSIELPDEMFGMGTEIQKRATKEIRKALFRECINHDIDTIFTFVTAFDQESDIEYLNNLKKLYEQTGGEFYFVELICNLEERLRRNVTEERLNAKPSKRDIKRSTKDLLDTHNRYRLNSNIDEYIFPNHIKIDNTNLSKEEVADMIINKYDLEVVKEKGRKI